MMWRHHIYKSLPLGDFMEHFCFALAPASYYALSVTQNINYLKRIKSLSEEECKTLFVKEIRKDVEALDNRSKLSKNVSVYDSEKFYEVMLTDKKQKNNTTCGD